MALWRGARYRMEIPGEPWSPQELLAVEVNAPLPDRPAAGDRDPAPAGAPGPGEPGRRARRGPESAVGPPAARTGGGHGGPVPAAIREDRPWPLPQPGRLLELGLLADAMAAMAQSLNASFRALVQENLDSMRRHLHRNEQLLTQAQGIAHLGSWELDMTSSALVWSDETFRLLGYAPGTLMPTLETFFAVVLPNDHAAIHAALGTARERLGLIHTIEHRVQGPDGVPRTLLTQGRMILDPAGQPLRLAGTCLDITARKEAELALNAKRRRLSNIIASTRVGTWEWEVQTGVAVLNERWSEILGYQLSDLAPISITSTRSANRSLDVGRTS